MTLGSISESLPRIVNEDEISVTDEEHEYTVLEYEDGTTSTKDRYMLDKAPVDSVQSVSALIDGTELTLTRGADYAVVDDNNDGRIDSIDFDVGGLDPDPNTTFYVTYRCVPIIKRYTEAHAEETDRYGNVLKTVVDSHQINNATGTDLDALGSFFGELGRRRGRNDDQYRAFLKTIVQSFSGRGTKPGLKFAVAAGIGTDTSNITIEEDFEEVGYEIRIDNVDQTFIGSVLNELADLADPSGVELLSDPIVVLDGAEFVFDITEATVIDTSVGLGGGTLTLDGTSQLIGTNPQDGGSDDPSGTPDATYDSEDWDASSYDTTVSGSSTFDSDTWDSVGWE